MKSEWIYVLTSNAKENNFLMCFCIFLQWPKDFRFKFWCQTLLYPIIFPPCYTLEEVGIFCLKKLPCVRSAWPPRGGSLSSPEQLPLTGPETPEPHSLDRTAGVSLHLWKRALRGREKRKGKWLCRMGSTPCLQVSAAALNQSLLGSASLGTKTCESRTQGVVFPCLEWAATEPGLRERRKGRGEPALGELALVLGGLP